MPRFLENRNNNHKEGWCILPPAVACTNPVLYTCTLLSCLQMKGHSTQYIKIRLSKNINKKWPENLEITKGQTAHTWREWGCIMRWKITRNDSYSLHLWIKYPYHSHWDWNPFCYQTNGLHQLHTVNSDRFLRNTLQYNYVAFVYNAEYKLYRCWPLY